ncbi:MAG: YicC family protein [Rhodobacteraceae bacterium]|nr:MAG: YicC family protein [Paracoccaceae bacterium]
MTGYASRVGAVRRDSAGLEWEWELRAVNGRGLDLRLRLPEGSGFLEKPLRDMLSARLSRGNISLSLRLRPTQAAAAAQIDIEALRGLLAMLEEVGEEAQQAKVPLQAPSALDLLSWRGVLPTGPDLGAIPNEELQVILLGEAEPLIEDFLQMRQQEGAVLARVIGAQLDQIGTLIAQARALLAQRGAEMQAQFRKALAAVMESTDADPQRVAQELALLAVKTDLAEELDRLEAHCAAGRALLQASGPVGRKLDFLTQEFNREANTLCSKAQHLEMTRIGLDLKTVIDQMREQVQNVE